MELVEAVDATFTDYRGRIEKVAGHPTFLTYPDRNLWNVMDLTNEVLVAKFMLRPFPNCSALAISYGINVNEAYRGKGLGTLLLDMSMTASRAAGYSGMIATVRIDNEIERHILKKLGWIPSSLTLRSRHGGYVSTWEVIL